MSLMHTVKEANGGSVGAIIKRLVGEEYCFHEGAKIVLFFEI